MPEARMNTETRKRLNRLAGQVAKFLELIHKMERAGGFPESPMDRDAKGESNPPLGEAALVLSYANRDASVKITPVLGSLLKSHLGNPYAEVLAMHIYDPGALRRWKAGQTAEDRENDRLFDEMCLLVAERLMERWDMPGEPLELTVHTEPLDEQAETPAQAQKQSECWTVEHSFKRIVSDVETLMEKEGIDYKAAEALYADRMGFGIPTMQEARRYVDNPQEWRAKTRSDRDDVWYNFA